jgi:glycolate oxidase FAD binding subunit
VTDAETQLWPSSSAGGSIGDGRHAIATVQPDSVEGLSQSVSEHVQLGQAIYPRGGATALDYGGLPRRPGIAIDTRSLDRVIDYPHADMTITVEAGIRASTLHAVLAEKGQRLLIDLPQADRATLGGVYATNTSGPRRFGFGRPRDQIIGVSFVTSEGVVVKGGGRVVKNVAGYDLPKLLTGSLGTLGIITQLTLKVRPLPEASAIVWAPLSEAETLSGTLDALNTSAARPVALEVLNRAAVEALGGLRSLPAADWNLAIGIEDNVSSVRWQLEQLKQELTGINLVVRTDADVTDLWSALTEFQATEHGPLACTANLRPSRVVSYLEKIDPARWAIQAHAGNGIVRMHALGDWTLEQAVAEVARLREQATGSDGGLVVSRCPTEWKQHIRVWGEPRPEWVLAERVKRALDPHGAMNPGRFVGSI